MIIAGQLIAESPIYRGNARKTLFTRDGDGTQKLVSLSGEISGTAQSLMDAFIGRSQNGKNIGLINQMWQRLFGVAFPEGLITKVDCSLRKDYYPKNHFFDLRMGIKLDDDRWAIESQKNYKFETLFRNSIFDFAMYVNDGAAQQQDNMAKLYYILKEMEAGRFWFGAGKSKGLGKCRLKLNSEMKPPAKIPSLGQNANYLKLTMSFTCDNPILISWPWGKLDTEIPSFSQIEGKFLIEGMRSLPAAVSNRLSASMGGAILDLIDWKKKFALNLPKAVFFALTDKAGDSVQKKFFLPEASLQKLSKGRYAIGEKILDKLKVVTDKEFDSAESLIAEIEKILGKDAKYAKRINEKIETREKTEKSINVENLTVIATSLGFDDAAVQQIKLNADNENRLMEIISKSIENVLYSLNQDIDRQIKMLQSDPWIDLEITGRREHLQIKEMLLKGKITERQWDDMKAAPSSIKESVWRQFKNEHARVRYKFMCNRQNLQKSIQNDNNYIEFLTQFRNRVRQELSQLKNYDFRSSGGAYPEISKKYGKPYDNMFMRMLQWGQSDQKQGEWEIFIPGSTIKGAFRKRATMLLNTIFEEKRNVQQIIDCLFGTQGRRGLVLFSDAHLMDRKDLDKKFRSMDGVRMNPNTGKPVEEAKCDFLFAYGSDLCFSLSLEIQDISDKDLEALDVLKYLIADFSNGEIPLGSLKTSGFGWVKSTTHELEWLTLNTQRIHKKLFGKFGSDSASGIWRRLALKADDVSDWINVQLTKPLVSPGNHKQICPLVRAREGFISHSTFGGYCGQLFIEGTILTPTAIRESGEPSFKTYLDNKPVNGWDFFSFSPPEASMRPEKKEYAIPSKSLKGMIRNMYAITSNSISNSSDISRLNKTDSLFGWVGNRPNAALMGRVSVGFASFQSSRLVWHKNPFPYGEWQFDGSKWIQTGKGPAAKILIANHWRLFPHAPLAPSVQTMDQFSPDMLQAVYMNAMMPDSRFTFSIRYWNLEKEELQRLIWCIALEDGLAHKIGNGRYVGFGSVSLKIQPDSYFIDWKARYQGKEIDWQIPLKASEWIDTKVISNLNELRKVLHVK